MKWHHVTEREREVGHRIQEFRDTHGSVGRVQLTVFMSVICFDVYYAREGIVSYINGTMVGCQSQIGFFLSHRHIDWVTSLVLEKQSPKSLAIGKLVARSIFYLYGSYGLIRTKGEHWLRIDPKPAQSRRS